MPKKRYSDENIEAYVNRKIKKIEKKLRKRRLYGQRSSSQDSLITDEPFRSNSDEGPSTSLKIPLQSIELNTNPANEAVVPANHRDSTSGNPPEVAASKIFSPEVTDSAIEGILTIENQPIQDILPDDILEILGEAPVGDKRFGPAVNSSLAIRWEHTATNGLSKEVKKDILATHDIPENCKKIDAPILNQEVKAALSDFLNKKDKAIENKQKQIALIIACLGDALSLVLSSDNTNLKLVKSLTDAGKLACDLQHTESMIRRSFICSSIKKGIKDHLYTTQIDSHLFGSQLGDLLKAAKAINKTGEEMKTAAPAPGFSRRFPNPMGNLNARRPPPPTGRQTGAAARRPMMPAPTNRSEYHRQQRRAPPPPTQPRAPYKRSQTHAPHRR